MKVKTALLAAGAISLICTSASAVDWSGYFRVGPGQKQSNRCAGGSATAAGSAAPGHGGIGRLGNECATYGEFALSQGMQAGGVNYKAYLMTNFSSSAGSVAAGLTTAVNQLYVEGKGYDIAPDVTFWIGERFYHRADVHFDDSFYVAMSGTGVGADGINTGFGSLSIAAFRTGDNNSATTSTGLDANGVPVVTSSNGDKNAGSRLNFDLEGIDVNPGGKLRATLDFTQFKGAGGKSGFGFSLQHNQSGIFGGENTAWLQYAKGSAALDMGFGKATDDSSVKKWRIADSLAWLNGPLTAQTLIHYGHVDLGNNDSRKTFSLGGRVGYALTKNFKLQGELGYAQTKKSGSDSENITKFTVAPTLTVGPNYYDRPELRFYVSTFSANDSYSKANGLSKKSWTAVGFQAEIWF